MRRVTLHHIAMFLRFCLKRNASLIPELPTYLPQAGWAGLSLVCQAGIGAVQAQKQALWMSVTLDMHNKTLRNKRVYYTYKYIYMYIYINHGNGTLKQWHSVGMVLVGLGRKRVQRPMDQSFQPAAFLSQAKRKGGRSFEEFRWVSTAEAHDFSSPTVSSCLTTFWCISNASSQIINT